MPNAGMVSLGFFCVYPFLYSVVEEVGIPTPFLIFRLYSRFHSYRNPPIFV